MAVQSSVALLKQRFENLFPGKWVNADDRQKTLLTGMHEIDQSLTRGLVRQRITEWTGPRSSGKTSILRAIISQWCASGFDVAYIDVENKLVAADWTFVEEGRCGAVPEAFAQAEEMLKPKTAALATAKTPALVGARISSNLEKEESDDSEMPPFTIGILTEERSDFESINSLPPKPKRKEAPLTSTPKRPSGKFWVIRNLDEGAVDLHSFAKQRLNGRFKGSSTPRHNHLWAADELIRANAFDVVILDLGTNDRTKPIHSRIYARLQNSLGKSKTALIILKDTEEENHAMQSGWGSHAQLDFHWGETIKCVDGLRGAAMIMPSINCAVVKDGLSQSAEVSIVSNVPNRLFTHTPIPDRRTPKT
jgi:hypothetical protein